MAGRTGRRIVYAKKGGPKPRLYEPTYANIRWPDRDWACACAPALDAISPSPMSVTKSRRETSGFMFLTLFRYRASCSAVSAFGGGVGDIPLNRNFCARLPGATSAT